VKGDKGDPGLQGLPGDSLVRGAVLLLKQGTPPPPGYTPLGSWVLSKATRKKAGLTFDVYLKN